MSKQSLEKLERIAKEVSECQKCSLYKTANRSVPGEGTGSSGIFFIGEAPGKQEDKQGIPFCGRAGKLLDELLDEINLEREDVFIGNVLKHRPPNNRDPEPSEARACFPYLKKQLNALKPKVVVTLGRHAMEVFLPDFSISKIHGQPKRIDWERSQYFKDHDMYSDKIIILPLYHPAVGLYRASMKDTLIEDFKKIPAVLEKIDQNN